MTPREVGPRGRLIAAGVLMSTASVLGGLLVLVAPAVHRRANEPAVAEVMPTAPENLGWAGPEVAEAAWRQIGQSFPKFEIRNPRDDNRHKRVVHWDATRAVHSGDHNPTVRQLIGDCVGAGHKHVVEYLLAIQLARDGIGEWKSVYLPYHYAMGRNHPECGNGRIRGPDGSVGSWQAQAILLGGFIPEDTPGLEPYSRSVVRRWAVRMPAPEYQEIGRQHLVRTVARVTTAAEVRDAICNGYPVVICSDWGGLMRPPTVDGRLVNRKADKWMHCMCIIGYDGSVGEPLWYILNSWGSDAHGRPPDDSPPGGFWVHEKDVNYIVRQGDSFAFSDAEGFPSQDWLIIKAVAEARARRSKNAEMPVDQRATFARAARRGDRGLPAQAAGSADDVMPDFSEN